MWCPAASMGSRRASGGAGEQDTGLVMRWISVAPAGPFDVLDAGVRGLGASIGNPVGNEDFDGWPPGLDGGPQPPSLLHVGGQHVAAQDHLVLPGLMEVLHLEEPPELLLHPPGRRELVGGVVGGEYGLEPRPRPRREGVVSAS